MPFKEIAQQTGMTLPAVMSAYMSGMRKLREQARDGELSVTLYLVAWRAALRAQNTK